MTTLITLRYLLIEVCDSSISVVSSNLICESDFDDLSYEIPIMEEVEDSREEFEKLELYSMMLVNHILPHIMISLPHVIMLPNLIGTRS